MSTGKWLCIRFHLLCFCHMSTRLVASPGLLVIVRRTFPEKLISSVWRQTWMWTSLVCRCRNVSIYHRFAVKPSTWVKLPALLVLVHHYLVVKVCCCQHFNHQSGNPYAVPLCTLYSTRAAGLAIQCHCVNWAVSRPMYKYCTIRGEKVGVQNLRGDKSSN